eukprot:s149_g4.t1
MVRLRHPTSAQALCDQGLFRASSAQQILSGLGKVFAEGLTGVIGAAEVSTLRPEDVSSAGDAAFAGTEPVSHVEVFISHTWGSPRWLKLSLHLLPSCALPPVQEEQEEPDAVLARLARGTSELTPFSLDLLLHGWQPNVHGVRKTAVLRFLALPRAAQLAVLDRRTSPVYKYTLPPKAAANTCSVLSACLRSFYGLQVHGRLHSAEEWPPDALCETGSDTEGSDTVGDLVPVGYSSESAMGRNHR